MTSPPSGSDGERIAEQDDRPDAPAEHTVSEESSPVGDGPGTPHAGASRLATSRGWLDARVTALAAQSSWKRHLLIFLVFLVIAAPMVGARIATNYALTPYDEVFYADYVYQIGEGDLIVQRGESIRDWTLNQARCRGVTYFEDADAAQCAAGVGIDPRTNPADIDPPTYYLLTYVVAQPVRLLGADLITAARLAGIVWAALSMLLVYRLARAVGAVRPASFLAAMAIVSVPLMAQQYNYITPHALDVVVGAGAALLLLAWWRRRAGWWAISATALLAVIVKQSNVTIVALSGLFLLTLLVWPGSTVSRPDRKRAALGILNLMLTTAVLVGGWLLIRSAAALNTEHAHQEFDAAAIGVRRLLENAAAFVTLHRDDVLRVFGAILIAAAIGGALSLWARSGVLIEHRALAAGYVLAALASPPALVLSVFLTTGQYVPTEARYGLALLPVGLAAAAMLLRSRWALVGAGAFLGLYYVAPLALGLDGFAF